MTPHWVRKKILADSFFARGNQTAYLLPTCSEVRRRRDGKPADGPRRPIIVNKERDTNGTGVSTAEERAASIVRMATRAFGDGSAAAEWLAAPSALFGGSTPLLVARETVAGYAKVCRYLIDLAPD
jgi:Protein of unknown function (DUF2384)